jgi:hypothetical protein
MYKVYIPGSGIDIDRKVAIAYYNNNCTKYIVTVV